MDKLELFSGGFPGTTQTWSFIQTAYTDAIGALTALGGDTYILKGVARNGAEISAGAIVYQGEYLPFVGGVYADTVSIYEDVQEVRYNEDADNDGNLDEKPAYKKRYAKCGDGGVSTFSFEALKQITPVVELSMPKGGIIMWSGTEIPKGWQLCDGTNGSPDLTNRFVVGSGGNYNIGDKGGLDQVALTIAEMPQHNHSGTTDNAGNHRHTGNTSSSGSHTHSVPNETGGSGSGVHFRIESQNRNRQQGRPAGSHVHTLNMNNAGIHNHTITTSNTGNSKAHENRPPYYALAFIQWKGQ